LSKTIQKLTESFEIQGRFKASLEFKASTGTLTEDKMK